MLQIVYLGIGGNQEETLKAIEKALNELALFSEEAFEISKLYKTSPVGDKNQNNFTNLVCRLHTSFDPKFLLKKIELLEKKLGKTPKPKWASRLIDIDILFYGDIIYSDEALQIPHLHWQERLFVLIPLLDLTPTISIREGKQSKNYDLRVMIQNLTFDSSDWVIPLNDSNT
ncbi:2-amino-4-hydroxy-6-hydroxymethyldihydropteridine diphosphokinase [Candidatus Protochlamydia sp. W-9]|uniref:2-amino-4-hydroxy-6- hydroxymethyldihydropteridine diphosphokinase n=1 Tax=Candidatus Protochlamydia sp. W-9 TaxID=1785087 RepID=UPI00096A7900|nr:2-amino-4-hydroxy-6-hydroxymethyldihydropteridine diphosphokinase [Candidatus Protochlamydia sp. W-9]